MALHADVNAHEEWDDVEDMRKDMYRGRARAIAESDAAAGCLLVPPNSLDARVAAAEVVERRPTALFLEVFWGFDHRSEERRVGQECVSTCRDGCAQHHQQ